MTSAIDQKIPLQNILSRLAQQTGISEGTAWTATKLLHIRLYKTALVPEILDFISEEN